MSATAERPAIASSQVEMHLPSPTELPEADILIYDGKCKFCTAQVRRVAKWDGKGRVAFLSLQDPEVAKRFPDLTYDQLMEQMYLIDQHGNRYAGAAAFRYLTRKLPSLYVLAPLMHIPFTLPLWQWCYRQVAKRRYKIAGKTDDGCEGDTCGVHFK